MSKFKKMVMEIRSSGENTKCFNTSTIENIFQCRSHGTCELGLGIENSCRLHGS